MGPLEREEFNLYFIPKPQATRRTVAWLKSNGRIEAERRRDSLRLRKNGSLQFIDGAETHAQLP